MFTMELVNELAEQIKVEHREGLARRKYFSQIEGYVTTVKDGAKYVKIDRGPSCNMSGFLMIEKSTGLIYGIKAYGQVHKGHCYGNLENYKDYDWSEYYPRVKVIRIRTRP